MNAEYFIKHLSLTSHPEGGYFRETYRAKESISVEASPERFAGDRSFSTGIYYLLEQGDCSGFHKIKSDECWHFYAGETLLIHIIDSNGAYRCIKFGPDLDTGEVFQFVVPANTWFASEPAPDSSFCLTGRTVAPGFDFADFEIAKKENLLASFPHHCDIITKGNIF